MKGEGEGQNRSPSDQNTNQVPQLTIEPAFTPVITLDTGKGQDGKGTATLGGITRDGSLATIQVTPKNYDDEKVETDSEDEEECIFKPYTEECFARQVLQVAEEKRKLEEKKNRVSEGRLVDGELIFDDNNGSDEEKRTRDPGLAEGCLLPESLGEVPQELIGKPIDEIDPDLIDQSFVVVAKRFKKKYIYRFSSTNSFFILSPWNPLRRLALRIATHQMFDYIIILTILVNCVFLALPSYGWALTAEVVLTVIYTLEAIIKLMARGFFVNSYTYLRDAWNWLDFVVIVTAWVTIPLEFQGDGGIGSISGLRTFRVLRALKTVSVIPGLKTIISALLKSLRMLAEVMVLTLFCMMVFALFALQVYVGVLRHKCVVDPPSTLSDFEWTEYVKNASNWYVGPKGDVVVCGNATGAGSCPSNHTCLPDIGDNPNFGYTNFDDFGWSMLNSFQLITLDFWEDPFDKVIRASGPWNIIFFIMVVFFGSFYLINLMLAVVSMSYEEESMQNNRDKEREKERAKKKESDVKARNKRKLTRQKSKEEQTANHLRVMSAVNGSTSSSLSLKSIGNGSAVGAPSHSAPLNDAPKPAIKETDVKHGSPARNTTKEGVPKSKPELKRRDTLEVPVDTSVYGSKSETRPLTPPGGNDNGKKGYVNPLVTMSNEDALSIDSNENDGDPPLVIVADGEDDELVDRNCECCARHSCNYISWLRLQNKMHRIVSDLIFELFITFCIALNVIFMGIEHYGMSKELEYALNIGNYVFTGIFTVEAIFKMMALSKTYFHSGWNIFDLGIVIASFIDVGLQGIQGLLVFRALRLLRLLRVFKLAQTWATMRVLLTIILNTLGALGNLTFILGITIYIFAVIGMQLFSDKYTADRFYPDEIPRWNFNDFWHSIVLIFRVLCGEWIEPLWDCMRAAGTICMGVFLPTLVLGNFMVLNLFLALLINSFASDAMQRKKETSNDSKMKQGWHRLKGLFKSKSAAVVPEDNVEKKPSIANIIMELKRQKDLENAKAKAEQEGNQGGDGGKDVEKGTDDVKKSETNKDSIQNGSVQPASSDSTDEMKPTERKRSSIFDGLFAKEKKSEEKKPPAIMIQGAESEDGDAEDQVPGVIEDCFPAICTSRCACCACCINLDSSKHYQRWYAVRVAVHKVTEHKVFEYFILFLIFASSISLCFEDIHIDDKPVLKDVLYYLNLVYVIIFCLEMVLKWIALGFKTYFTNFWTILDFLIVVVSVVSLVVESTGGDGQISSIRALRTLRAFRPLRAISRWQGMKIVVNALMYAIPAIFNVLTVCGIFWLIFSIAGVQLFGGTFYRCLDPSGEQVDCTLIANKSQCLDMEGLGYRWQNTKIHFNDIFDGLLALFQVATFEGWMEVMDSAVDAVGVDKQPCHEKDFHAYWFFIIFIIIGTFFALNLIIGVIIDNFNMLKKKYEGGYVDIFLTQDQRNYYNTMKKLGNRKPQKTIKRPKNSLQAFFFDVSMSTKFELAIVILIFLNMIAMTVERYNMAQSFTDALDIMNIIFTTIFTLEAIVKIVGMRWHYFRRAWNVFDFIIVLLSLLGVIMNDILRDVFVTPSLLRVVRVFRIGRVLRLVKAAKGIRKLLFALVISLPALFNIALLLFLIVFIYAIFGMSLFMYVKPTPGMDDVVNFQTFGSSMLLLFRLTTAAGWNEILEPLLITPPDCNNTHATLPDGRLKQITSGDCGIPVFPYIFMTSFTLVSYLIIINMYIAVILENFSQAHEQEEVGITEDDFEMFYVVWERYDPHATQFIKYDFLSDFVADLDLPLGMPKPNEIALVAFDLPIYEQDRLHCLDILVSLVKHVLGGVEETEEFKELKQTMDDKYHDTFPTRAHQKVCSSTMKRKKEDVAAKTLQRCWRQHRAQASIRKITEMAMEAKLARERGNSISGVSPRRTSFSFSASPAPPQSRPDSAGSMNSVTPVTTKTKTNQAKNALKKPNTAGILLPSDNDVPV